MLHNRVWTAPLIIGIALSILGLVETIGWAWHTPMLMQAGLVMALPTAICFTLSGIALALRTLRPDAHAIIRCCGAAIILLVVFSLIYLTGGRSFEQSWNTNPHAWLDSAARPRMSLATSLLFLGTGIALCLSRAWRYYSLLTHALGVSIAAIGAIALLSYALHLEVLYNWYFFSYMELPTAVAALLLGIGLWFSVESKSWLAQREDGGVVAISIMVLLATTIAIGIASWSTEQGHLVTALGDGLRLAVRSRSEQIATVIELRATRAAIIANRPNLLKNLRVLASENNNTDDKKNKESKEVIAGVLRSFEPFGFSAMVIYGSDQRELARSGELIEDAVLAVPLASANTELLWRDGFYLRRHIALYDDGIVLGELVAEQPLSEINAMATQIDEFARSDVLLLCAELDRRAYCFPSASSQQPILLPENSDIRGLAAKALSNRSGGMATIRDSGGRQAVTAYAPVGNLGLVAILKSDTAHLYKPLLNQFQRTLWLLVLLISVGAALIYTRVRPLVRALRVSEQRLQSALRVSDSHVWDFDFRSDCILASPSLRARLGFTGPPQPIALAKWRGWVHPDDLAPADAPDLTRALLLQDLGVEVRLRDNNGEYHWYYFRGGVVERDIYGTPLHALGTATDISARKEMEQQLIAARIAADDANHAKSLFLSSMSHELRTPLNGVLGYAQILLDSPSTSPEQQRQLSAIESCGQHLLALINDVLDLSKIESGNIEIQHNNCNLYHLLESVSDIVRQRAHSKGLQFSLEIDKSVPSFICIDDIKLRQILVNLLGNAVKFTQQGSVSLRVSTRIVNSAAAKELTFQVRDTGIGIPLEKQKEIFQPFRQIGRSAGGTGLGLSISQRLSEAMGGVLLVQSGLESGSCFSLSLPLVLGEIAKTPNPYNFSHPTLDTGGAAITVMIADDNPINRQVLSSIMRANGIDVVEAENGQEVLDKLRQYKSQQRVIPLVLMDVRMPVMDGFAATRLIKSDADLLATKVIVVSASVSSETIAQMGEVGCDDFIKKPVRVRELLEKVAEHLYLPLREIVQNDRENLSS